MNRRSAVLIFVAYAVSAAACSEHRTVDAEVVSIRWIPKSDIDQVISRDSKLPKIESHSGGFYVATIATKIDLVAIQREKDYSSRVDSRLCDNPEQLQLLTPLGLYEDGNSIGEISVHAKGPNAPLKNSYNYELVIFDSNDGDWKIPATAGEQHDASYPKFDLVESPEDICIRIKSGGVRGGFNDLESNEIVISKEQLLRAITDVN